MIVYQKHLLRKGGFLFLSYQGQAGCLCKGASETPLVPKNAHDGRCLSLFDFSLFFLPFLSFSFSHFSVTFNMLLVSKKTADTRDSPCGLLRAQPDPGAKKGAVWWK